MNLSIVCWILALVLFLVDAFVPAGKITRVKLTPLGLALCVLAAVLVEGSIRTP